MRKGTLFMLFIALSALTIPTALVASNTVLHYSIDSTPNMTPFNYTAFVQPLGDPVPGGGGLPAAPPP